MSSQEKEAFLEHTSKPEAVSRPRMVSSRPRPSQGNRATRRHAAALTGMKAPRGVQDDPHKVVKRSYVETSVPCKESCGRTRQNGSSRCTKCAQPRNAVTA